MHCNYVALVFQVEVVEGVAGEEDHHDDQEEQGEENAEAEGQHDEHDEDGAKLSFFGVGHLRLKHCPKQRLNIFFSVVIVFR